MSYDPADFFLLRTPLLPLDEVAAWREAPDRVAALRAHLARPILDEAIRLASSGFRAAAQPWLAGKDDEAVQRTAVKYFLRAAERPTPFGLFAGVSLGRLGETTKLELSPRAAWEARAHADFGRLVDSWRAEERDPAVRRQRRFRPNTSLAHIGDELRYAESVATGDAMKGAWKQVSLEASPHLLAAIDAARRGASFAELARVIASAGEVDLADAEAYLDELIDSEVLISEHEPALTGARPPAATSEDPRAVQVDLAKPGGDLALGREVVDELRRAVDFLLRARFAARDLAHERFVAEFEERFGNDEVPLRLALDECDGVGMPPRAPDAAPLVDGLGLPGDELAPPRTTSPAAQHMLKRLFALAARGAEEWVLDEADVKALTADAGNDELPTSLCAIASILASSVDDPDWRLLFVGAAGPPATRLLGRFGHVDPELCDELRRLCAAEHALAPDALHAEVVHLPAPRLGNVCSRPTLRPYEIPFLGRSGLPREQQLDVDDLVVRVEGGQILLRSKQHDRQVVPYLSSAHPYYLAGSPVYRFLGALAGRGKLASYGWAWGMFAAGCKVLPRVRLGRTILAPRQWNLEAKDVADLAAHGVPRRFVLQMGDEALELDQDNPLEMDTFAQLVRGHAEITLVESLAERASPVVGDDGHYANQIMLPLVRRAPTVVRAAPGAPRGRQHMPGRSAWFYAKLYAGTATADRLLCEKLPELLLDVRGATRLVRWHFLRYRDPAHHLRLRFLAPPAEHGEILDALHRGLRREIEADLVHRLVLDTYAPEYSRYGGPEGVARMERFAHADSEAILAVLQQDPSADQRWRYALVGLHTLLDDFGLDLDDRLELVTKLRDMFLAEHGAGDTPLHRIGEQFRRQRGEIEGLLATSTLFRERSRRLRAIVAKSPRSQLVSHMHMHVNRLLPARQRSHELVLHDYLRRCYESLSARRTRERRARSTPDGAGATG